MQLPPCKKYVHGILVSVLIHFLGHGCSAVLATCLDVLMEIPLVIADPYVVFVNILYDNS